MLGVLCGQNNLRLSAVYENDYWGNAPGSSNSAIVASYIVWFSVGAVREPPLLACGEQWSLTVKIFPFFSIEKLVIEGILVFV